MLPGSVDCLWCFDVFLGQQYTLFILSSDVGFCSFRGLLEMGLRIQLVLIKSPRLGLSNTKGFL